ncbi:MAG: hypothetical protein AAF471_07720, partial [Myxococcota bacterium]
ERLVRLDASARGQLARADHVQVGHKTGKKAIERAAQVDRGQQHQRAAAQGGKPGRRKNVRAALKVYYVQGWTPST